ncbi:MAG: hypothetical protein HKN19_19695 [Halioglobus sp.]|nr:hypothetical protein [Halioglobus sp.]
MSLEDKIEDSFEDVFEGLAQERDELRVRMHLASMEVRDKWEELEAQWEQFAARSEQLKRELEPTVDDTRAALILLKDELAEGYRKIRDRL